jgi:gas vesicle protein
MADGFERDEHEGGGNGFMMGLLTGTVLGAGLGMLLAPKRGSELRTQISEQASSFGRAAGEQLRRASDAASGIVEKARETASRGADGAKAAVKKAADDTATASSDAADSAVAPADTGRS